MPSGVVKLKLPVTVALVVDVCTQPSSPGSMGISTELLVVSLVLQLCPPVMLADSVWLTSPRIPRLADHRSSKPIEVVFLVEGDHVKMTPVKRGISDDAYVEITDGLKEEQEVVSGGYKAINRELEEAKKVKKGAVVADTAKDEK